ncbi:MAG: type II toxin-antitoxin system RelE/ParE family toxin [Lachnospiraceae bacterium]
MQTYNIAYAQEAVFDLDNIERHIALKLKNPDAAWSTVNGIITTIEKIINTPKAHPLVEDSYLSTLGFRLTYYKNYNMLYIVQDETMTVYIVRILYNRRDWTSLLRGSNIYPIN